MLLFIIKINLIILLLLLQSALLLSFQIIYNY